MGLEERLFEHDTVFPDQVRPGTRNPEVFIILRDIGIEDTEISDDAASFVREKIVVDPVLGSELAKNVLPVVADGKYLYATPLEGLQVALQLNELRPTKWSPRCAPVKQNESLATTPCVRKADEVSELVGQLEIGHGSPHGRSRWDILE